MALPKDPKETLNGFVNIAKQLLGEQNYHSAMQEIIGESFEDILKKKVSANRAQKFSSKTVTIPTKSRQHEYDRECGRIRKANEDIKRDYEKEVSQQVLTILKMVSERGVAEYHINEEMPDFNNPNAMPINFKRITFQFDKSLSAVASYRKLHSEVEATIRLTLKKPAYIQMPEKPIDFNTSWDDWIDVGLPDL